MSMVDKWLGGRCQNWHQYNIRIRAKEVKRFLRIPEYKHWWRLAAPPRYLSASRGVLRGTHWFGGRFIKSCKEVYSVQASLSLHCLVFAANGPGGKRAERLAEKILLGSSNR